LIQLYHVYNISKRKITGEFRQGTNIDRNPLGKRRIKYFRNYRRESLGSIDPVRMSRKTIFSEELLITLTEK